MFNGEVAVKILMGEMVAEVFKGEVAVKVLMGEMVAEVFKGEVAAKILVGETAGELDAKLLTGKVVDEVCTGKMESIVFVYVMVGKLLTVTVEDDDDGMLAHRVSISGVDTSGVAREAEDKLLTGDTIDNVSVLLDALLTSECLLTLWSRGTVDAAKELISSLAGIVRMSE